MSRKLPMRLFAIISILLSAATQPSTQPASQPADPTMNWLLSGAATAPATQSDDDLTTQPAVLISADTALEQSRPGEITLSDGSVAKGRLSTTLRQPLHVFVAEAAKYVDVPFAQIKSIEARVVWERQDQVWNFAASGSDIKIYSGKTYPNRMTAYVLTLKDGTTVAGSVAAPIYLDDGSGRHIYILHKRDKGEVGQALTDLVYVKMVRFSD
jgi:hypothetical protein